MSLIAAVRDYIATYPGLASAAPVWVDHLDSVPTQYAIIPLPGGKIVERYLDGGSTREYLFAVQIIESTADDATRLDTAEFTETFADWLEAQTDAGTLPTLDAGQTAESMEATSWGYLMEQGQSDTGVYMISCRLVYEQEG